MSKNDKKPSIRFKGYTDTWEQCKVGDLGEVVTGSTPATSHPEYYSEDGISWVTPTDINKNVTYDTPRKLSEAGQKVGRVVPKNTILVTCIASIGKNTILGNMGSFNQQINGLVPDFENYDPYFLFTESVKWSQVMKRQAAAGTMQIVNKTEFSNIETAVPNFDEQKKIGSCFKNLDNLITLHQRKYEKLVSVKKSMLEKMFPRDGQKVPEIRFSGFTDPWEQRKVCDVAEICAGGTPNTRIEQYWFPKEISWLSSGEVHKKNITWTDGKISKEGMNNSSAKIIPQNSVLIALAGQGKTRGTVAINRIPLTTNQSIAAMIFPNKIVPEFVFSNLEGRYEEIRRMSSGDGSRGGLNKQIVGEIEIPYTSKLEQERIGQFFRNLDNLITLHQRELEKLKNIKKSLLEEMFI